MAFDSKHDHGSGVRGTDTVYDVAVIGAGIQGSATAYYSVKQGMRTLLLEQFSLPHTRGSSHGQSRIIRYSHPHDHYMQLITEAYKMWAELEKEAGTEIYRKTGLLKFSVDPKPGITSKSVGVLRRHGRPHRVLDHHALRRDYPEVNVPDGAHGFFEYDGGTLKADKALQAFQAGFVKRGGVLRDEARVQEIIPAVPVTIRTSKRSFQARSLVITPGTWASKILRPLGLVPPLKVWRINVPYWKEKVEGSMDKFPNFIIRLEDENGIYGVQASEYPGMVKIPYHAGSDIVDPDRRDDVSNEKKAEVELLEKLIVRLFPRLESKPAIIETCMYTNTEDGEMFLDRHPLHPNIAICCGCSGHGFKFGPIFGKILYLLATGKDSHIDISPMSFKRYKDACLITNGSKL